MIFSLAGVPLSCLEHLSLYFAGSLVETWKPTGTQQWMQCLARKWLQFCPFSKTLWPTLKTLNAFKFKFKLYSEKANDTAIFFQLLNHLIFFTDPLPIYTPQDVSTFFSIIILNISAQYLNSQNIHTQKLFTAKAPLKRKITFMQITPSRTMTATASH